MNQLTQKGIEALVMFARESMERDGLQHEYINSFNSTWNALKEFLCERNFPFTLPNGLLFLEAKYGISSAETKLSCINKRHRRAIYILSNCLDFKVASKPKSFIPMKFHPASEAILNEFLDNRKKQNLSFSTINLDIRYLNFISQYLSTLGDESITSIRRKEVVGFINWLSKKDQLASLRHAAGTWKRLLNHLYQTGRLEDDWSTLVPQVKKIANLPQTYSEEEIQSMFNAIPRNTSAGIRNYAMALLAARLGMRISDICELKFGNIFWNDDEIRFSTEKNGIYTVLPITKEVGEAIIEYLKKARPTSEDAHVFLREQRPYKRFEPGGFHQIITNAMRSAGVIIPYGKRHGPHALRASLATRMLANGEQISVISGTLSHSNINSVRSYIRIDINHLRQAALEVPCLGNVWMGGVPK